jgi:lysophospholipase L1-like esterase
MPFSFFAAFKLRRTAANLLNPALLFAARAILPAVLLFLSSCGAPFSNAFMGDSITAFWSVPGMNLGVPGNTTAQMLARYPSEVPGRGYRTFILLGGTNDVRYHVPSSQAIANIAAMASQARAEKMNVVLCTMPPNYENHFDFDPAMRALNALIRQLAQREHYYLVDYYGPMVGHPEYFKDQIHPNAEGYAVMNSVLIPVLKSISSR